MAWLLCGLLCGLVLLGLALLLAVVMPLLRRLRHSQVEVAALRIAVGQGSARLRVGQELLRERRPGRG